MNTILTVEVLRDLLRSQPDHDLVPNGVLAIVIAEVKSSMDGLKERVVERAKAQGWLIANDDRVLFLIGLAAGAAIAFIMMD